MRIPVMTGLVGAAGVWMIAGQAAAQPFNVSCVKGGDERSVEIASPGEVGAACDVRYQRGGVMRTPYHANNSSSFCTEKAGEIVSSLITSGFACGQVGGPLTAEARLMQAPAGVEELSEPSPALREEPSVTPVIEAGRAVAAPDAIATDAAATPPQTIHKEEVSGPRALAGAASAEAPLSSAVITSEPLEPVSAEDILDTEEAPAEGVPVGGLIEETHLLSEPARPTFATRGPAALTDESLEALRPAGEPIAAGHIVGVSPEVKPAPPPHSAAQRAQEATPHPAASPQLVAVVPAAVDSGASAPSKKVSPIGLRAPEEVIIATLHAQAAAWNEGNLRAFMDTYWNDDDLKFVSGTVVTRGWSTTMKRYRERYADGAGLGQLAFDKADVEMITDEVAVVTGRYNLVRGEEASSGAFSLVMKRMDGVWRIVHDHTAGDLPKKRAQ